MIYICFFVASHEIFPVEDLMKYNCYRVSRGTDQTVFIRLVLCFLYQILRKQWENSRCDTMHSDWMAVIQCFLVWNCNTKVTLTPSRAPGHRE